jgi:hypothetical protein
MADTGSLEGTTMSVRLETVGEKFLAAKKLSAGTQRSIG